MDKHSALTLLERLLEAERDLGVTIARHGRACACDDMPTCTSLVAQEFRALLSERFYTHNSLLETLGISIEDEHEWRTATRRERVSRYRYA